MAISLCVCAAYTVLVSLLPHSSFGVRSLILWFFHLFFFFILNRSHWLVYGCGWSILSSVHMRTLWLFMLNYCLFMWRIATNSLWTFPFAHIFSLFFFHLEFLIQSCYDFFSATIACRMSVTIQCITDEGGEKKNMFTRKMNSQRSITHAVLGWCNDSFVSLTHSESNARTFSTLIN